MFSCWSFFFCSIFEHINFFHLAIHVKLNGLIPKKKRTFYDLKVKARFMWTLFVRNHFFYPSQWPNIDVNMSISVLWHFYKSLFLSLRYYWYNVINFPDDSFCLTQISHFQPIHVYFSHSFHFTSFQLFGIFSMVLFFSLLLETSSQKILSSHKRWERKKRRRWWRISNEIYRKVIRFNNEQFDVIKLNSMH